MRRSRGCRRADHSRSGRRLPWAAGRRWRRAAITRTVPAPRTAANVGQAEVAAAVAIGEVIVIRPKACSMVACTGRGCGPCSPPLHGQFACDKPPPAACSAAGQPNAEAAVVVPRPSWVGSSGVRPNSLPRRPACRRAVRGAPDRSAARRQGDRSRGSVAASGSRRSRGDPNPGA